MISHSMETRKRKYVKEYAFLSFLSNKFWGLDAFKTSSRKVVHKAAEATGKFIGNLINDIIVKPNPVPGANSTRKERKNTEWVKASMIKWGTIKYQSY